MLLVQVECYLCDMEIVHVDCQFEGGVVDGDAVVEAQGIVLDPALDAVQSADEAAAPEPGRCQGRPRTLTVGLRGKQEHKTHRQDRRLLLDTKLGRGAKPYSKVRRMVKNCMKTEYLVFSLDHKVKESGLR